MMDRELQMHAAANLLLVLVRESISGKLGLDELTAYMKNEGYPSKAIEVLLEVPRTVGPQLWNNNNVNISAAEVLASIMANKR
jgi:hypothetical protein